MFVNQELINKLIDVIQQVLTKDNETFFSTGDFIAIGLAFFSALVTIYIGISTNYVNKKINADNIDANITANARIEWIQNVRNCTAEVISQYYTALNETDVDKILMHIIAARKNMEMLILYFGPEDCKDENTIDMFDEKTNNGKNDLIVKFLINISKDFVTYYENTKKGLVERAEQKFSVAESKLYKSVIGTASQEEVEVGGETFLNTEYLFEKTAEEQYEKARIELSQAKALYTILDGRLIWLRDAMRIYLKIEWNKAKKGK